MKVVDYIVTKFDKLLYTLYVAVHYKLSAKPLVMSAKHVHLWPVQNYSLW